MRIAAHRVADVAGALPAGRAKLLGEFAIGDGAAETDPAQRRVELLAEVVDAVEVDGDGGKIDLAGRRDSRWMSEITDWIQGGTSAAWVLWHFTARRSSVSPRSFSGNCTPTRPREFHATPHSPIAVSNR